MSVTARIDERVVTQLWERQAFDQVALERLGLRVIFRGVPSDAGGPDYQDAVLSQRDLAILHGDVEFHVSAADWYGHGHHADHRYNTVILHVVWHGDTETVRADGTSVPVLALERWCDLGSSSLPRAVQLFVHPCVAAFGRLDGESVAARVHRAGMIRFEQRSERFQAEMAVVPPDEIAYRALLEGLGYASNRQVFRDLALTVPYGWLQSISPAEREAALLDAAGLGPPAAVPPPGHLADGAWRLTRLRPGNHPAVRLTGVARLLETLGPRLADALLDAVLHATKPSDLRTALWVANTAPPRKTAGTRPHSAPIGAGRADELAVSAVLPFAAALLAAQDGSTALAEDLYLRYSSPPRNRWTRLMQGLLRQAGHEYAPRRAPDHQGLHHLYHEHCRMERRAGCPVCGLG